MKLTNKQKLSIQKSLKLNEDFFDDFDSNELIDEPVDELIDNSFDEHNYTYHIQFLIFMYPFVKLDFSDDFEYVFDDPKYEHKLTIEHGFISIKKALEYILQATPIVSDYSKPKFCSSSEKLIEAFPFMNNKQSDDYKPINGDDYYIMLETSINLYKRKNAQKLIKMLYSFWNLQKIYDKLVTTIKPNIVRTSIEYIDIRVYKNNPYKTSKKSHLIDRKLDPYALELINLLNSKDETDK